MPRFWKLTALLVLAAVTAPAAAALPTSVSERRVLAYAQGKLGKQVGNGECWTLADAALNAAGARRPGRNGYGPYVFGQRVALAQARPGDVLQFENVRFERRGPGGAFSWQEIAHHTAIVESVEGKTITLLHQNVNGVRRVQRGTIRLDELKRGTITAYRPQPR